MTQLRTTTVLIVLGAIFGSSFLFVKVLVAEVGPMTLVTGRLLLASAAVLALLALRRKPLGWTPTLAAKVTLLSALSLVVPFGLISWAEQHIDSGVASTLVSTMPLFTALLAAGVFADERLTSGRLAGLLAGFAGVVVLTGGEFDLSDSSVLGQLAVVAAGASYGAGAVYSRALLRSQEPLSLGGLEMVMGTLLALPLAFAFDGTPDVALSAKAWGALVVLGVAGTAVAFVAYLWLVEQAGSVRASLVTYIVPVAGLLLGWAVLDERFGLNALFGGLLIVLGVASGMLGQAQGVECEEPACAPVAVE